MKQQVCALLCAALLAMGAGALAQTATYVFPYEGFRYTQREDETVLTQTNLSEHEELLKSLGTSSEAVLASYVASGIVMEVIPNDGGQIAVSVTDAGKFGDVKDMDELTQEQRLSFLAQFEMSGLYETCAYVDTTPACVRLTSSAMYASMPVYSLRYATLHLGRLYMIEQTIVGREPDADDDARMERLLEAHSEDEVTRLLQDCGYPALDAARPERMDAALSEAREALLADLGGSAPDAGFIDIFKLKYDYHNAKAVLKAAAVGTDPARMFMDMGRIPASELKSAMESSELDTLPGLLPEAVAEAKNVLDTTRDPQLSDITLDGWMYRDMARTAERTGSAFLRGYVAVQVDAVNLRTAVRTLRMGKGADFLLGALLEGGDLAPDAVAKAASSGAAGLRELYGATRFRDAAEAGAEALKGGPLTAFEKLCDDAVGDYLAGAQSVPFGEAPLVSYLAARETEYTNLRILLMGRAAGIDPAVIRTRLRASYV